MAEQFANLASTTLTANYTAGGGSITVNNTAGDNASFPFPVGTTFRVVILDATTQVPKVILKVTAITDGTHFATVAEGTDANGNSGDLVACVLTAGAIDQMLADERGLIPGNVGITIDGGGSVPATGSKGFLVVPFAGTITGWYLLADVSGSAQITIKKCTYSGFPTDSSIVASAQPKLTSAQKNTSTTLTGWTTSVAADDIWEFNLDSVTTCTRLNLFVQILRS
jgi:hypothetical protein